MDQLYFSMPPVILTWCVTNVFADFSCTPAAALSWDAVMIMPLSSAGRTVRRAARARTNQGHAGLVLTLGEGDQREDAVAEGDRTS
jgi:hypothetical protein